MLVAVVTDMKISGKLIVEWAEGHEARASLPRLIRRLVHATAKLKAVEMPAGEAVNFAGWDGTSNAEVGSAWVPEGLARWEWSCEKGPSGKATTDFDKRTLNTPVDERATCTFVFVTARRWPMKEQWIGQRQPSSGWKEIRVYDASNIEEWLEQAPCVALAFSEELGLVGPSVESPERFWSTWASTSSPEITIEACWTGRTGAREQLAALVCERVDRGISSPLSIRTDTAEEGAALACSAILEVQQLCGRTLVVTAREGWRFVERNPTIAVAIAASPEIAERVPLRSGLAVVIPYGASDMAEHFRGASGDGDANEIKIDRPLKSEFATALEGLGLDESDADRWSGQVGRSWSIFRRRRARSPAVRRPAWLASSHAEVLSTICLAGGWKADRQGDQEVIARIAERPYQDIERALIELSKLDDAPVLRIGSVWKAKSPLELLDLFSDRISATELDRYFSEMLRILQISDPELELPMEDRYAASMFGKKRAQSALLIQSLTDTLTKLSVRGAEMPDLSRHCIVQRVENLVHDVLSEADSNRWLSLAGLLRSLAEAAPAAFLGSVEMSLAKANRPITALFSESNGDYLTGRRYHVDLLWALELLAWSPRHFVRVVGILAELSKLPLPENLGNRPCSSLTGLFRSWLPQTGAAIELRLRALTRLVNEHPDVAFDVSDRLVTTGSDIGDHSARPHWRGDDAGFGRGVPDNEHAAMIIAAADHQIALAKDNVGRLCRLIGKLEALDEPRVIAVLQAASAPSIRQSPDLDREKLCNVLRQRAVWHLESRSQKDEHPPAYHDDIVRLSAALAPDNPIVRHRWLFANGWPETPIEFWDQDFESRSAAIEKARHSAMKEVVDAFGLDGVERLAELVPAYGYAGGAVARLGLPVARIKEWLLARLEQSEPGDALKNVVFGLLNALPETATVDVVTAVAGHAISAGKDDQHVASLLALAPVRKSTWELVARLGPSVDTAYWQQCSPAMWIRADDPDFQRVLEKLCDVRRPRTALQAAHFELKKVDPHLLLRMLEQFALGQEDKAPLPSSWDLREAIDRLENDPVVDRKKLAIVEFRLFEALGFQGESHAKSLYSELMNDPQLFVHFICTVFRPKDASEEAATTEKEVGHATHIWRILHNCRRLPGSRADGSVETESFGRFICEARRLCSEAHRLEACDTILGEILAHSPADAEGVWPFEPTRDILDRSAMERMRHGFRIGTFNKRGIVSKSWAEGGNQERKLAAHFRTQATALHNSHPLVAETLERVAQGYERDGLQEDERAQLTKERY